MMSCTIVDRSIRQCNCWESMVVASMIVVEPGVNIGLDGS